MIVPGSRVRVSDIVYGEVVERTWSTQHCHSCTCTAVSNVWWVVRLDRPIKALDGSEMTTVTEPEHVLRPVITDLDVLIACEAKKFVVPTDSKDHSLFELKLTKMRALDFVRGTRGRDLRLTNDGKAELRRLRKKLMDALTHI